MFTGISGGKGGEGDMVRVLGRVGVWGAGDYFNLPHRALVCLPQTSVMLIQFVSL